jgi:hypothetical protein
MPAKSVIATTPKKGYNNALAISATSAAMSPNPNTAAVNTMTKTIMFQLSVVSNLFGRHFCPFAPGFRKSNGNGLLSGFDSLATLPAL